MVLCAVVTVALLAVDHRTITGSPAWLKPLKFEISIGLYAATLAWMLHLTPHLKRLGWWAGTVAAVAGALEMAAVILQAARGVRSHFNVSTAFDATVFGVMGVTVVFLWTATLLLAIVVSRNKHLDRAVTWAIRLGITVSLVGMSLGFLMTSPTPAQEAALDDGARVPEIGAHAVGVPDGGPGIPGTGWSTVGGDLRVPHFFGIHALQALPLLALLLAMVVKSTRVRIRLVWTGAVGWGGMLAILTWQALRGQSLVHPDTLTLEAVGALAIVVGVLAAASFSGSRGPAPAPLALRQPEVSLR